MSTKPVLSTLPEAMRQRSTEEVGASFVHWALESEHQGWDGHDRKDLPAYRRLFEDFALCLNAMKGQDSPIFSDGVRFATRNTYENMSGSLDNEDKDESSES
jgi:hypothetical protein